MNLIRDLMGIPKLELKSGVHESQKPNDMQNIETYIVSKMYTPKRKDELSLNKGDVVNLIEERNGRCFVETISKESKRQERGWIPLFCLQKQVKSNAKASGKRWTRAETSVRI